MSVAVKATALLAGKDTDVHAFVFTRSERSVVLQVHTWVLTSLRVGVVTELDAWYSGVKRSKLWDGKSYYCRHRTAHWTMYCTISSQLPLLHSVYSLCFKIICQCTR